MLSDANLLMNHAFGKYLKQLRVDRRLTVRELAKRADMAFPNVGLIEGGKRVCGPEVAEKLAWAMELV